MYIYLPPPPPPKHQDCGNYPNCSWYLSVHLNRDLWYHLRSALVLAEVMAYQLQEKNKQRILVNPIVNVTWVLQLSWQIIDFPRNLFKFHIFANYCTFSSILRIFETSSFYPVNFMAIARGILCFKIASCEPFKLQFT